jgi:hypothetical protein
MDSRVERVLADIFRSIERIREGETYVDAIQSYGYHFLKVFPGYTLDHSGETFTEDILINLEKLMTVPKYKLDQWAIPLRNNNSGRKGDLNSQLKQLHQRIEMLENRLKDLN